MKPILSLALLALAGVFVWGTLHRRPDPHPVEEGRDLAGAVDGTPDDPDAAASCHPAPASAPSCHDPAPAASATASAHKEFQP